jgi:hypothetical protein
MKDEGYLNSTELPNIDLFSCGSEFVSRYNVISSLLKTPPSWANNSYNNMVTPDSSINWQGEVIIKKTQ